MRRRALAGPMVVAAAGLALILAGCGGHQRHIAPGARLTVAPTEGHPSSVLRFTLVAPSASGRHGKSQLSYALMVSGRPGPGCVARYSGAVAVPHAGQPVIVALGPARLGPRWCPGNYTGRVDEFARPVCAPAQECPQFIRVVAVFGPVRFRIAP